MKGRSHLAINAVLIAIGSFIVYKTYGYNILDENLWHLAIAVYVFSNLPDIDSSTSLISRSFFIFYISLAVFGFIMLSEDFFGGMIKIALASGLAIYHLVIATDSKSHRKFPHSFTFGILCVLAHWYLTSFPIAVIAMICFVLHIAVDTHVFAALRQDMRFWSGLLRGRLDV